LRERSILQAAGQLFAEVGYEHANMDLIASEAGVTKATLYAYFQDKATLFGTVMQHWLAQLPKPELDDRTRRSLHEQLTRVAGGLVQQTSHPSAIAITQALSKSADASLLKYAEWRHQCYQPYQRHLEKILAQYCQCDDPRLAAHQFLLLVIGHLDPNTSEPNSTERVNTAISAFMRAYPEKRGWRNRHSKQEK